MSENQKIRFIHDINELNRRWKLLTKQQRRELLDLLPDEISKNAVLIAIRSVRQQAKDLF